MKNYSDKFNPNTSFEITNPQAIVCFVASIIEGMLFDNNTINSRNFKSYLLEHPLSTEIIQKTEWYLQGYGALGFLMMLIINGMAVQKYKYTNFYLIGLLWFDSFVYYWFTEYMATINTQGGGYILSLKMRWTMAGLLTVYLLWDYFYLKKSKKLP